ncbi:MAG TPA: hypothetical protein VGD27_13460 [Longimicrobiales bacterium]
MPPRKKAKLTAEKRRELMVAAAVAREALLQTHVARAMRLVELSGSRVSVMRMISIYTRLHGLNKMDTETLANRVLALLGRSRKSQTPAVYVEGESENFAEGKTIVGSMRERLRGRRLHDLRRWTELHTGSTQAALLDIHVRHALRFIEELRETHMTAEAIEVYEEMVEVPENMHEALRIFVLDKLANEELPKMLTPIEVPTDPAQVSMFPPSERRRPKRVG